jgi:hypothetical protein
VLYHISFDIKNIIYEFEPLIPKEILELENNTIKRICVSNNIANCLSAIPARDEILNDFEIKQVSGDLPKFMIYEFDEGDIINGNLLDSNFIRQYVQDAEMNNELWIVNQIVHPIKRSLANFG